jgi:DNA-binding MarR family transcriptional regulator
VTNIIDKLEADGLVRRVPHAEDRRATLAEITDEGRAAAKAATEVLNAECFGIASLAPRDLERLTTILRALRLDAGDFTP